MGRSVLAVLAGAVAWAVLWLAGTSGLPAASPALTDGLLRPVGTGNDRFLLGLLCRLPLLL